MYNFRSGPTTDPCGTPLLPKQKKSICVNDFQSKHVRMIFLALWNLAWQLSTNSSQWANCSNKQGTKETRGQINKLTLLLVLRDLVVIIVCVVPFILNLIHTQGCTHEDKHTQHTPDPAHMHDEALNVLLLKLSGNIRCVCHPAALSSFLHPPSLYVKLLTLSQLWRVLSL